MKHCALFLLCFASYLLSAQQVVLKGTVVSAANGEALPYASIYTSQSSGLSCTEEGFYSIEVSANEPLQICCSFVGMVDSCLSFIPRKDSVLNFVLEPAGKLEEVEVSARRRTEREKRRILTKISLRKKDIQDLPVVLGEADVLKTIQMLPQVQGGVEGSTDLFVRGSDNGQNLIYIDGVPVYNLSHTYGLFSAIDPNAVVNLDFYPGVAPAEFNGRLASYTNIQLKEGNLKNHGGGLNLGLISSRLWLEGPISEGKHSYFVSLRRSYLDLLFRAIGENTGNGLSNLTDGTAKLQFTLSDKSKLFFSYYGSLDNLYGNEIYGSATSTNKESWGNQIGSVRYLHQIGNKLISNSTLFYSRYKFQIYSEVAADNGGTSSFDYNSQLQSIGLRQKFDYFLSTDHHLSFGLNYLHQISSQPTVSSLERSSQGLLISDSLFSGQVRTLPELSLFFQGEKSFSENWQLHYGLAVVNYLVNSENALSLQPRLDLFFEANEALTMHFGYDQDLQYLHQLRFSRLQLPSDLWIGAGETILPGESHQFIFGGIYDLPFYDLQLRTEVYYKSLDNLISQKEGINLLYTLGPPEENVVQGRGQAYGIETSISRSLAKLQGQISYVYSRSIRQFADLNRGESFPFNFEQIHSLKLFASYAFSEKLSLSAGWVFSSGMPYQIWTQRYPQAEGLDILGSGEDLAFIKDKNNQRLSPFHRLNLNLKYQKKSEAGNRHVFLISIYNAYSRLNDYFLYYEPQASDAYRLKSTSYLPIVPMLSYAYEF